MRRTRLTPLRLVIGEVTTSFPETNLEVCVELGEGSHNTNDVILETIQELKNGMARFQVDKERFM